MCCSTLSVIDICLNVRKLFFPHSLECKWQRMVHQFSPWFHGAAEKLSRFIPGLSIHADSARNFSSWLGNDFLCNRLVFFSWLAFLVYRVSPSFPFSSVLGLMVLTCVNNEIVCVKQVFTYWDQSMLFFLASETIFSSWALYVYMDYVYM